MELRSAFSKKRRNELVEEAAEFLSLSYPFIAENALGDQLNAIATGHLMNLAKREELVEEMPANVVKEMDRLFFLMSLRALNMFTMECQGLAIMKAMRGETSSPPIESVPELRPLLEERIKIISEEEELQKKVLLASVNGKPGKKLAVELEKKQAELHKATIQVQKASGIAQVIT
ncbi:hypothetical protein ACFLQ2_02140 [archaeon]